MGLLGKIKEALTQEAPLATWNEPSFMKLRLGEDATLRISIAVVAFLVVTIGAAVFMTLARGPLAIVVGVSPVLGLSVVMLVLTWGETPGRRFSLHRERLTGSGTMTTLYGWRVELVQISFHQLRRCELLPYWTIGKSFSLLKLATDRDSFQVGLPKAVDLKRVTCVLAAGGVQVHSPDQQVQLLALQTLQASRTPGWRLEHAGITGTQHVGHGHARPLVLLGIVVGIPLLFVLAMGVLWLLSGDDRRKFKEQLARERMPAQQFQRAPGAQRKANPAVPPRVIARPARPKQDDNEAVVVKGGRRSPAKSWTFDKSIGGAKKVAFTPDGSRLLAAQSKVINEFTPGAATPQPSYSGHTAMLAGVSVAASSPRAISIDSSEVHVWGLNDLKSVARASGGLSISQAAISPNGKRAAFSDVRGLTLIDVDSNSTRKAPLERAPGIAAMTFNAPGDKLLLCTYDKVFVLSGEELDQVETIPLKGFGSQFAAFSADGQVVARHVSSKIELWDLGQKRLQASFPAGALAGGLALSADGQRVYFGADKDVVAGSGQGQELYRLQGHKISVTDVALSADGKRLASVSNWDGSMRLWELPE